MFFKNKNLVALILAVIILSVPISVSATVPVSTGYKGPGQTVFVVMHYEDASAIRHIQAKLEQDLIALEQAFAKLQNDGVLDPDFPRLVIVATAPTPICRSLTLRHWVRHMSLRQPQAF
jgi:hypothetical protein